MSQTTLSCAEQAAAVYRSAVASAFKTAQETSVANEQQIAIAKTERAALKKNRNKQIDQAGKIKSQQLAACAGTDDPAACNQAVVAEHNERIEDIRDEFDPEIESLEDQLDNLRDSQDQVDVDFRVALKFAAAGYGQAIRACGSTFAASVKIPPFGSPFEFLPHRTFLQQTSMGDGFLDRAEAFYELWGLSPKRIDTLFDVLSAIKNSQLAQRRVLITSHADHALKLPIYAAGGSAVTAENLNRTALGPAAVYLDMLDVDMASTEVQSILNVVIQGLDDAAPYFDQLGLGGPLEGPKIEFVYAAILLQGTSQESTGDQRLIDDLVVLWFEATSEVVAVTDEAEKEFLTDLSGILAGDEPLKLSDLNAEWRADAAGLKLLGPRLKTDVQRAKAALGGNASIDLRGCRVDPAIASSLAAVFGLPGKHVSHFTLFSGFVDFDQLPIVGCPNLNDPGELIKSNRLRIAVAEAARILGAGALPDLQTRSRPDRLTRWRSVRWNERLMLIARAWQVVPPRFRPTARHESTAWLGEEDGTQPDDCLRIRSGLETLARSLWADATDARVGKVVDLWMQQGGPGAVLPVASPTRKGIGRVHAPFVQEWRDQLEFGTP
jgi:hypothetical protein